MKALLLVDIQNDFLPGGALAVKEGDEIVPVVNGLMEKDFDVIVACRDWHPVDHVSFAENHNKKPGEVIKVQETEQILWPVHCVQGNHGAEFPQELNVEAIEKVFLKGTDPMIDSYSAFFDNEKRRSTGLEDYLRSKGADVLYVAGLATDYCVKYSVMDALRLGFAVYVVMDGCRGVDLRPGDVDRAIEEMEHAGAKIISEKQDRMKR